MESIEKINDLYHGVVLEIYTSDEKPMISLDLGQKIRKKVKNNFVMTGDLSGSQYFIPTESFSVPESIITLPKDLFKELEDSIQEGQEKMFFILPRNFLKKLNFSREKK